MTSPWIALVPGLRFGERELAVGDPVPVESGRDYTGMEHRREIGRAPAGMLIPGEVMELSAVRPADAFAGLSWVDVVAAALEAGVAMPAEIVDLREHGVTLEEFAAAVASKGSDPPAPELPTLEQLRELAAAHGCSLVEHALMEFAEVPIPDKLPGGREALLQLALRIPVVVSGTGSQGYVKESDLVAAIEAERARRTERDALQTPPPASPAGAA